MILVLLLAGCLVVPLRGQPIVILDNTRVTGFLAPAASYSSIKQQSALSMGVELALMINHATVVGLEGYGLLSDVRIGSSDLDILYGGLVAESIGQQDSWIHSVLRLAVGGGGVRYYGLPRTGAQKAAMPSSADIVIPLNQDPDPWDGFFVISPGAGGEVNIGSSTRLEVTANYRFVTGVALAGLSNSDLGGVWLGLAVKLGSF
jgi:hypothetical protein